MSIASPALSKRLEHIQALRGIAAVMVVLSHLLIVERKYSPDNISGQVLGDWALFGMVGVDLFFVISGFIMVWVMWERPRGIKAAAQFLWARAARIYPLYWLISLAVFGVYLVMPSAVFSSIDAQPSIWKSFALFPDTREPLLAVGWTLIHEMYFYCVFALIMLLPRRMLLPSLTLWSAVILGAGKLGWPELGAVSKTVFSPLTFEFIAGALIGYGLRGYGLKRFGHRKNLLLAGFIAVAALVLIWGLTLFLAQEFILEGFQAEPSLRVKYFIAAASASVLVFALRDISAAPVWKPLVVLGDWSYALYLSHILSLAVLGRVWQSVASEASKGANLVGNAVVLIAMLALTITVAGLIYHFVERPIMNAVRRKTTTNNG